MILFLDTETTGLVSKSSDWMSQPGICQIGAVKIYEYADFAAGGSDPEQCSSLHGTEADSFYTLVNPEMVKWHDDAIKTHGITPAMVADAPTFFEIGPALARFALGCRAWAGYNIEFDKSVLWHQLLKYGLERNFPWPPAEIDVMKIAAKAMETQGKRGAKNPKLSEAYQHFFGRDFSGAHDALSDIRATAELWGKIHAEADDEMRERA